MYYYQISPLEWVEMVDKRMSDATMETLVRCSKLGIPVSDIPGITAYVFYEMMRGRYKDEEDIIWMIQ